MQTWLSYHSRLADRFTAMLGAGQMPWRDAVLKPAFAYDRPPPSGSDIDSGPDLGCLHRVPSAHKASTTSQTPRRNEPPRFDAHLPRWDGGTHAEQVRRAGTGQGGSSGHRSCWRLRVRVG